MRELIPFSEIAEELDVGIDTVRRAVKRLGLEVIRQKPQLAEGLGSAVLAAMMLISFLLILKLEIMKVLKLYRAHHHFNALVTFISSN